MRITPMLKPFLNAFRDGRYPDGLPSPDDPEAFERMAAKFCDWLDVHPDRESVRRAKEELLQRHLVEELEGAIGADPEYCSTMVPGAGRRLKQVWMWRKPQKKG